MAKIKLSDIKLNADNPRVKNDHKFEQLVKSIADFPKMLKLRKLILRSRDDKTVIAGNMRRQALEELGYKEIPEEWVDYADEMTEEEVREFIIKDNLSFGEWDWPTLQADWDTDELSEWGLDVPDQWSQDQLAEVEDDDYEIPDQVQTDIVLGDLIEIGRHRLICGDSTVSDEWEKLVDGNLIDLMVTDPPYNVDYTGKTKDALKIQNDKMSQDDFYQFLYDFYVSAGIYMKKGASWYIWHADSEGHNFRKAFIDAGYHLAQCLIWVKNSMVMGRQDYHWKHEPCLYGWKLGASHNWRSDRKQTTVLEFDRPNRNAEHPTTKPIPLISYQINNNSKQGDIVADGFLGSGTTMVAAHQLGRICYGIELDPKYCQVIIDRMQKLDPQLEIKINGEPYNTP